MQCKDIIVLFKKNDEGIDENYVFDEVAFVDNNNKIISGKYKDYSLDDLDRVDLHRDFVNGYFDNYWIYDFNKREEMPDICYSRVSLNNIGSDSKIYEYIANIIIEGRKKHIDELIESGVLTSFIVAYLIQLFSGVVLRDDDFGYSSVRDSSFLDDKNFEVLNKFVEDGIVMPDGINKIINAARELFSQEDVADRFVKTEDTTNKEKNTRKRNKNLITIKDLVSIINDTKERFIGQEAVVDDLAMNIYLNTQVIAKKAPDYAQRTKSVILLDGSTGTGKTAILQDLSNRMSVPFVKVDGTSYTSYGYKGPSLTDILKELLILTNGDVSLAEEGIICIDEFDKLASPRDEKSDQIGFKRSIQHELLKFGIDGQYRVPFQDKVVLFDTSRITMIYMGAFTDLRKKLMEKKTISKRGIGFNSNFDIVQDGNQDVFIGEEDLISFGYRDELIGRIKLQVTTKDYTEEDLKNILLYSKISPLLEFVDLCKSLNKVIKYDDGFIDAYASYAFRRKTGARALQKIADEIRNTFLSTLLFSDFVEIVLTSDIIKKLEQSKGRRLV